MYFFRLLVGNGFVLTSMRYITDILWRFFSSFSSASCLFHSIVKEWIYQIFGQRTETNKFNRFFNFSWQIVRIPLNFCCRNGKIYQCPSRTVLRKQRAVAVFFIMFYLFWIFSLITVFLRSLFVYRSPSVGNGWN